MPPQRKQNKVNEADKYIERLLSFYSKHTLLIWLAIIFLPLIIISIGCMLWPELFYDQFVWHYFWGTIEADANPEDYGEVTEAYNPINTIFYAFIVIIVLYWLYKMFKKYQIRLDSKFFLAIIPFIVVGGLARTLEDAELFTGQVVYLFIAPIIYIVIGVLVIVLLLLGVLIREVFRKTGFRSGFISMVAVFVGLDIVYLFTYFFLADQFSYILHPIVPIIISLILIIGLIKYIEKIDRFEISAFLLTIGLWFLIIGTIVICQWQSISSWTDAYSIENPDKTITLRPLAFLLVIGLTLFGVALVYVISKILVPKYSNLLPFLYGTNLILFFGHFLDASATFIAIDYFGYVEKHVLPTFMIEVFQTAAVMYLLKAVIIIFVVYFIDIIYREDFSKNPTLTGLVKIAILVLGLAPGLRDVLRLAIGV